VSPVVVVSPAVVVVSPSAVVVVSPLSPEHAAASIAMMAMSEMILIRLISSSKWAGWPLGSLLLGL
jgi:hypothetical protein